MSELKGKAKMVRRVFRCPYIHIGAKKIAEIADTGVLSEEDQIAYAAEFVRRWNAFEDGGILEELVKACEELVKAENCYASSSETLVKFGSKIRACCVPLAKAALAKAKPE